MFLTKKQKKVIEAQLPTQRSQALPHERLDMHESTIHSYNTLIFHNFKEAIELMGDPDVFELFKGRFKKHEVAVWESTRELRLLMKREL